MKVNNRLYKFINMHNCNVADPSLFNSIGLGNVTQGLGNVTLGLGNVTLGLGNVTLLKTL